MVRINRKHLLTTSKIKRAISRATFISGSKDQIIVNKRDCGVYFNSHLDSRIKSIVRNFFPTFPSIHINVGGGGASGQARSVVNSAIKLLCTIHPEKAEGIKEINRGYLVDDRRRRLPKRFLRKGATARYQLSFR